MWVIAIPIIMVIVSVGLWQWHESQGHHRKRNPGTSTMSWDTSITDEIRHKRNYKKTSLVGKFIKYNGKVYRITGNGYNKQLGRYVSGGNIQGRIKMSEDKAFRLVTKERCLISENGLVGVEWDILRKIVTDEFGEGFTHVINFIDGELSHYDRNTKIYKKVLEETATEEWQKKYFKTFKKIQECVLNGVEVTIDMVVE